MRTFSKSLFCFLLFLSASTVFPSGKNPAGYKNGMVVTASDLASEVGVSILKKGGNAVDASVGVGFALAVTFPFAGNIGGGGFMVIHLADGKNTSIDFRETAPQASSEKMFLDSLGNFIPALSQQGWTSSGVPGTVAGLIYALKKYGTMNLSNVIQPAIDLAENGFVLNKKMVESLNSYYNDFINIESSRKIFTKNGNKFSEGDLFVQKDLARTLRLIKDKGEDAFYRGEITEKIIEQSKKFGGNFTLNDFNDYKVAERLPVTGSYREYKIISMPPPSSGGICILEALHVLEKYNLGSFVHNSTEYIHILSETLKHVYADRAAHMGDPDFYDVPVNKLLSDERAEEIKSEIGEYALPSSKIKAMEISNHREKEETTHYSVADKNGNAVSTTYTINGGYGNKIVVDGLGFLLNNEMDDFSAKPGEPNQFGLVGSEANSIKPKKRMLSSMTPTIIMKDDKLFMVIGSPGGSTIITSVLQSILNAIDFKMNIEEAIAALKIHDQWLPDQIEYEEGALSNQTVQELIRRGHKLKMVKSLGRLEGITFDQNDKLFFGSSDPRGSGKASGW